MTALSINNVRRYYLLKHFAECEAGDDGLLVWRAKQDAVPGTALSLSFPSRAALVALGYSTVEDLTGADVTELQQRGFSGADAATIIAAIPT